MATISTQERDDLKRQGALESDVRELKKTIPQIYSELKSIRDSVAHVPMDMMTFRNKIDIDVKKYAHEVFLTDEDMNSLKSDISYKIDTINKKLGKQDKKMAVYAAIIAGFVSAGSLIMWIINNSDKML